MAIDLVIFDCDGVLVDSETITAATIADATTAEGLSWAMEDVKERFRGGNMKAVVAAAEAELGRALDEAFVPRFREQLYARLGSEIEAIAGIAAAIDAIEARGLPYCVASNGPREKMHTTLGATGLLPRFEGRVFSAYEIDAFKPDPGLFLHAAQALGAQPARCVVVEDSENGLRAALAAGMHAVAYVGHGVPMDTTGAHALEHMDALPALLETLGAA